MLLIFFVFTLIFYILKPNTFRRIFHINTRSTQAEINDPTLRYKDIQNELNIIANAVGKKYGYPALPNLKYAILDENESHPILMATFKDMQSRAIMMANDEDYYPVMKKLNLNPATTIFIEKNLLLIYLGDSFDPNNLTPDQIIIGKVLFHEGDHLKQQKIVEASGLNLTLYDIFWQKEKPTPSNKLFEGLTDARLGLATTPSYRGEEIKQAISNKNEQYKRLNQIYELYIPLMKKLDNKQTLDKQEAEKIIKMLQDLNNNPSDEEIQLLGLE